MGRFHRNLALAGLAGLVIGALLTGSSLWLVASGTLTPPLPYRIVEILLVIVLAAISLAEIPLMVFAIRRLASSSSGNSVRIAAVMNGLFVLFAAVYAVPVSLLTGNVAWTLVLSALCIIRFATSMAFVREPAP